MSAETERDEAVLERLAQSGQYVLRRCDCCGEFFAVWAGDGRRQYCATCRRNATSDYLRTKARRRAAFFAARDAAFERAGLPIPKIVVRNGVRIENRGTIAWGGRTFSSNPSIRQSVNPSILH